jgi:hypothetical protein
MNMSETGSGQMVASMLNVLALDPGGYTGICKAEIYPEVNHARLSYFQERWLEADLWMFLNQESPDALIYESFQYRPQGMRQAGILRPVELIGVLRLYEQLHTPIKGTYPQGSDKAVGNYTYFTDIKLKEMELYLPGLEHGRVACKHMLYWLFHGAGTQFVNRHRLTFDLIT